MPDSWRFAHQMTTDLVRQIEYLTRAGRAESFDTYLLRQADGMLRPKGISLLVSGTPEPPCDLPEPRELVERAARFSTWGRAIVTAVLLELDERTEVTNPHHALTCLISCDLLFAKSAARWTAEHGMAPVQAVLSRLPGYALLLLAATPNDTAERFMARDAFWTAVMGNA
jgi:hypothetical protein